jgi:hypothetical protein
MMGLWHSFTRPHLLEAYSPVVLLAALENLFLWVLLMYMIIYHDRENMENHPVKWSGLIFTLLLFGFVGMISVASGGMVRYRIPALPFFWLFFIHFAYLPPLELLKDKMLFGWSKKT